MTGNVAAWLGVALMATACGGNDDSARTPEERYPGEYSRRVCAVMGPCCEANGLSFDEGNCVLGGAGYLSGGVDRAREAGAVFDADTAEACIQGAVTLTKTCTPLGESLASSLDCASVWNGTKAPGSTCTTDFDCASTTEGRGACAPYTIDGEQRRACVVKTPGATVGDVCGNPDGAPPERIADCAGNGLQCDLFTQLCKELTPLGQPCAALDRCAHGAYCDDGTCAAQKAAGDACGADAECSAGLCLKGACAQNGVGASKPCTGE